MREPLIGVRVLDLSRVLAGPWAGQLLADYGADVIKVERPGAGDDTRGWGPPWWGEGMERQSAYFLSANRGKRSIAVDIATPEGAACVRELAAQADVVIENYKAGQLGKYGLDYDSLRTINPRVIYCSITGFGLTGPYRHHAGYDIAIQAMGGLMSITGEPDGEPQKVGVAVVDVMTGLYATTAILAALKGRGAGGEGTHIDCSLLDVMVATLANQASNFLVSGVAPQRMGNAHPNIVPYQVFATADGHLVLAVGNDTQFRKFCGAAGRDELARDERYLTNDRRVQNRTALVAALEPVLRTRSTAHWIAALESESVPCAPILGIDQVFENEHVRARGLKVELHDDSGRQLSAVASPVLFDGIRAVAKLAPPRLDQHATERKWAYAAT